MHVAKSNSIETLKTPYRAPHANAICERFLGSLRREYLDHILILREMHVHRAIGEYLENFNRARQHQGIGQKIPERPPSLLEEQRRGIVIPFPVLNGLHDYRLSA